MNWLISANGKKYRHADAFNEMGYVDWRQTANYEVGDTVYIYSTRPLSKVQFKCVVEKNNMKFEEITDDKEFWLDLDEYYKYKDRHYSRLKLVDKVNAEGLSLGKLKENGLKAAPQGPMRLKGEALKYIEKFFEDQIVYPDEIADDNLYEGLIKTVRVNRYERNKEARDKCIEYHGKKCSICGFDFEKVYGELGKGFIHVHHIKPLSEIDKEYKVDYKKDLIPVCPNCHAMLHKKIKGEYITIKALKDRL
jgi:5-methylcytosine-specific restriction protein A